jgi:hypothetical protein
MPEIRKIRIRSCFYGAGSFYKWTADGYHAHGIGVNIEHLKNYDSLNIIIEGKSFNISCADIINFANKYKSYKKIDNSLVRVAVFSKTLLDPKLKAKQQKPPDNQTTLYDFVKPISENKKNNATRNTNP